MPRLFTGFEIPEWIARQLALCRGGLPGARWIDEASFHITLRFFGDVDRHTADDLAAMLDEVRRPNFPLDIGGLDAFGGGRPRSLIASVAASRGLIELQAEHERIARRAGLPPDSRKFTPHVTLARLGGGASPRAVADYIAMQGHVPRRSFSPDRFVLFSARSATGGGPYLVESEYPLPAFA